MKLRLLSLLLMPLFGFSQHQNVIISQDNNPNEPSIMVNPKNTNQIVAAANIMNYYFSSDGGLTWTDEIISSSLGVWGDPCIIVDTADAFYFLHLSNPDLGNWIDRIVCQKMETFGGAWSDGSYMGLNGTKAQDKHWAVVNRTNNHIYTTWTQFDNYGSTNPQDSSIIRFSKSTYGGQTWSPAIRINRIAGDCLDEDNTVEGAVPAVGPNGEIYVSWMGPEGILFDRSTDEGQSWLYQDIFVSDLPGGWDFGVPGISRCNGFTVTLCDLSNGPNHGTIYINWSDQRNGTNDTDVWLKKSTDGGNTWSTAVRVNNDPPGKHQFFSWMDIDQVTGYLWCVFYDRRNYANNQTDVYMARSTDGGQTFTNFKISETPFLPNSSIFFGDYNNVSACNNVVRPIWTRLHQGTLSIYTALINTTLVGMEENGEVDLLQAAVYPNPADAMTYFSYKLHKSMKCNLKLIDNQGRDVHEFFSNQLKMPGKYIESLDTAGLRLSPGMYYFLLEADGQKLKKEAMVIE